jgi:hypothetical protein
MRAEGKELLLAGFFSLLAAAVVGLFWSGGGVPRDELGFRPSRVDPPRPYLSAVRPGSPTPAIAEVAVPGAWPRVGSYSAPPWLTGNGHQGPPTPGSFGTNQLGTSQQGVSLGPPTFGPNSVPETLLEQGLFGPYGIRRGLEDRERGESLRNLSDTTPEVPQIDLLGPGEVSTAGTPSFAAEQEGASQLANQDISSEPTFPSNVLGKGLGETPQNSPRTAAPETPVLPGEAMQAERDDSKDMPQIAESSSVTTQADTQTLGVAQRQGLPEPALNVPGGKEGGQPEASDDSDHKENGNGQQKVGPQQDWEPCPCGPLPGFRRCWEPRPGWVPPCGLLRYLRKLLECRSGKPMAEALCLHLEDLANAVVASPAPPSEGRPLGASKELFTETSSEGFCCLLAGTCNLPDSQEGKTSSDTALRAEQVWEQLRGLQEEFFRTAERVTDFQEAVTLRRAGYALARRLPLWREVVAGNPFAQQLLQAVEQYEASGSAEQAATIARLLAAKNDPTTGALVHELEQHFRNSNLRWEISESLLNRWIQPQPVRNFRVRDVILGLPVIGESRSDTEVRFALVPDAARLRCRLVITGRIVSATQSLAGAATFWDHAYGSFIGWKEIELTDQGLKISPPQVQADQRVELRGLRTQFDGIPLLGAIAQEVALSQRERSMPEARAEARQKLIARVVHQFEAEATPKLVRLQNLLERRLLHPARQLRLEPTLVEATTYADRLVARWRLAGEDQLGGHTPRPRVPEGSLASFQIHQSAVNNLLSRLELSDRPYTPAELRMRIAELLDCPELLESGEARDDVLIWFAGADAMRVTFDEGQLRISLAVTRLEKKPHAWRNFQVRVAYKPETSGGQTFLVRDGVVTLTGESLSVKDQITLRGIFSRTFSKERSWPVLPRWFRERPELQDVRLSHFVMDDGWLSWAVAADGERGGSPVPKGSVRFATACPSK